MKKHTTNINSNTTISNLQGTIISNIKNVSNVNYLYWLGGFVEGEGCVSISVVVNPKTPFGIQLQPVFNVTQHENGLSILQSFSTMFGIGKPHPKSGSPHIWVYAISGYKNMFKHVFPFYYNYVLAFGCKIPEFEMFHAICVMLEKGSMKPKKG